MASLVLSPPFLSPNGTPRLPKTPRRWRRGVPLLLPTNAVSHLGWLRPGQQSVNQAAFGRARYSRRGEGPGRAVPCRAEQANEGEYPIGETERKTASLSSSRSRSSSGVKGAGGRADERTGGDEKEGKGARTSCVSVSLRGGRGEPSRVCVVYIFISCPPLAAFAAPRSGGRTGWQAGTHPSTTTLLLTAG